ncbi:hypothetical protein SCB49_14435 [unidentified eubacterium SCB49]|nr:hypothetical protein SCB49_14435 [unidentified eubacterium SCB49]
MDEASIKLWSTFALALGIIGLSNFIYAFYLIVKAKKISVWYGVIALLVYIPFIYLYGYHLNDIIPFSIPQWMVSGNIFLYVGTFLMPTLAYSLFILVAHFTPKDKEYKVWVNLLIAMGVPITGFLFSKVILPLWHPVESMFFIQSAIVLVIVATLLFFFFLIRAIVILISKKTNSWTKYQLVWKIPITILLPLLGLAVNNGHLFNEYTAFRSGVFGDFNNNWFYILAIVNGVLICLPNIENKNYRVLLFLGRSITVAYTFYFFLVFLPFLPFSVMAIVAMGSGFLMLTPLLLFVIHIKELSKDYTFLKKYFLKSNVIAVSVIASLSIPTIITITYINDKSVLNETLSYIYTPDYTKEYDIDTNSLQKTLNNIKNHKGRQSNLFGDSTPYLSSYFKWLVLDNLSLSNKKINTIEKIFFNDISSNLASSIIEKDNVKINDISAESVYDKTQNVWKSWVNLEITNYSNENWLTEYATTINLPEGAWISDYYLFVGDRKEPGILAEKKSALWIFSQIRNINRDPGILYYLTGNEIAFSVFPFAKDEV